MCGLNFYLNKTDYKQKKYITSHFKYTLYCVRGNHEARPDDLEMTIHWDHDIGNFVRIEKDFPTIKYLYDGGIYNFNGHKTLVIGGAYSVDKWYRLNSKGILDDSDPDYYNPRKTGWFHNECLTPFEMKEIEEGKRDFRF